MWAGENALTEVVVFSLMFPRIVFTFFPYFRRHANLRSIREGKPKRKEPVCSCDNSFSLYFKTCFRKLLNNYFKSLDLFLFNHIPVQPCTPVRSYDLRINLVGSWLKHMRRPPTPFRCCSWGYGGIHVRVAVVVAMVRHRETGLWFGPTASWWGGSSIVQC